MTGSINSQNVLSIGPRSVERPADTGATLVAGIDGRAPALVDGGGLVSTAGSSWSVDWWIGADDRWHLAAREPSVRQRRIGHGPVIETALRVPSGDVIHTAYPVVLDGRTLTVIDIRNDSPVPVALALAVRPYPVVDPGPVDSVPGGGADRRPLRLELLDGGAISVDGVAAIRLPRRPNEAGANASGDLFDDVARGDDLHWSGPVVGPDANAVCLYPLPHGTSLRFAIASGPAGAAAVGGPDGLDTGGILDVSLDRLPDGESVARGWTAVIDRAARFEFPETGITALAAAARARLLLAAPGLPAAVVGAEPDAGLILRGLAVGGHRFECRPALEAFAESFPTALRHGAVSAAELLGGIGLAAELVGDVELGQRLLEPAAQLTHLVERSAGRRRASSNPAEARAGLARLVGLVGQDRAAADLLAGFVEPPLPDLAAITAMAERAAPARRWTEAAGTTPWPSVAGETGGGDGRVGADGGLDDSRVDGPDGGHASGHADSAAAAARFWIDARRLLIDERRSGVGSPAIDLLPGFPTAWRGGPLEVHHAPIAGCSVSFAIRWHGYRPALLWDIEPSAADGADGGNPARVTCSGLDPAWRADRWNGEALLAGSATDLPAAPAPGDSFL